MEAEYAVDAIALEHARFADETRAARGFFGRLEYQKNAAGQFVERFRKMVSQAEHHGHVAVVAAGVHMALVA